MEIFFFFFVGQYFIYSNIFKRFLQFGGGAGLAGGASSGSSSGGAGGAAAGGSGNFLFDIVRVS